MTLLVPSRRGFLTGLASLLAAPAVVRAASLMPVQALRPTGLTNWLPEDEVFYGALQAKNPWVTLEEVTREGVRLFCDSNKFYSMAPHTPKSSYPQWDRTNAPG